MKLMSSPASPFGRKVKALLIETRQIDEVEVVTVKTSPLAVDPLVQAANPIGKIPALIRPEGPALYDSNVICRFLDARVGAGMYPEARLWDVLTIEATADGLIEAALAVVYETRFRDAALQNTDWMEAQWGKAMKSVSALNDMWISHLNGPVDMSHIAVGCALGYLDFRHADKDWRAGNQALAKWYEGFAQRPCMQGTIPADLA